MRPHTTYLHTQFKPTHFQTAVIDIKWNLVDRCVRMQVDVGGEMRLRNIRVKRDVKQRHCLLRMQHAWPTETGYLHNE